MLDNKIRYFRWLFTLVFMMVVSSSYAVPVLKGLWKMLTLADGTQVKAEARGDEFLFYWQAQDGTCYVKDKQSERYIKADLDKMREMAAVRRAQAWNGKVNHLATRASGASRTDLFRGTRKGLIILVQFSDTHFTMSDPQAFYQRVANEKGFHENGFKSSVRDYFLEQSNGTFDLMFDVEGPVTLSHPYHYYGDNDDDRVAEMIKEACKAVDSKVNFSDYDWDKDGTAEEVFVLYAGFGQNDHPDDDEYIWPHMFKLEYSGYPIWPCSFDNTNINVYACANELRKDGSLNGMGIICHEFSHCMGFPDFYDTEYGNGYGLHSWDLMDAGCYNDNGHTPAGYSGYEKWQCGWLTPIEVTGDLDVSALKPVSEGGDCYIIYNPGNRNEYYVLDNRQKTKYDSSLPGQGLLVTHVDYDPQIWNLNIVNSVSSGLFGPPRNTHERVTIIPADNVLSVDTEYGDAYPYGGNNSLTRHSTPATTLHNVNLDGTSYLNFSILDITQHADGTVSFRVKQGDDGQAVDKGNNADEYSSLLSETFDQCVGNGGNDGQFRADVAQGAFVPDLSGWDVKTSVYGGHHCASFGSVSGTSGEVTSPTFQSVGDTLLVVLRVAPWDASSGANGLRLRLNGPDAKFVQTDGAELSLTMTQGTWSEYRLKIVGSSDVSLTFGPSYGFFMDQFEVKRPVTSGISGLQTGTQQDDRPIRIYNLWGVYVGEDLQALPPGIYIVGGKKMYHH